MTIDWVHGVGQSTICQTLLQIAFRMLVRASPQLVLIQLVYCQLHLISLSLRI